MTDQAIDYNQVAADAADRQLLLNVVRAAKRNPTHYTAISQLRDSRSNEGSGTFGGEFPLLDHVNDWKFSPTLGLKASTSPSFDVAPLDTRNAALGLYRPVDTDTFAMYWQQNWSKNLLMSLFVDSITLNQAAVSACEDARNEHRVRISRKLQVGNVYVVDNAAYSRERFDLAQDVFRCLKYNMYVVEKNSEIRIANVSVPDVEVMKMLPTFAEKGFEVEQVGRQKSVRYSVKKHQSEWQFVLNFASRKGSAKVASNVGQPSVSQGGVPEVALTMRSIDGMVYFLGEVLRQQLKGDSAPTILSRDGSEVEVPKTLFAVDVSAAGINQDNISVRYLGETYSVNRRLHDRDLTLTSLALISQLFSLYRENTEQTKTQAVQIVGTR